MYVSSLINNTKSKVYKKYCKTHRIPQLFAIHLRNHLCCLGNKLFQILADINQTFNTYKHK